MLSTTLGGDTEKSAIGSHRYDGLMPAFTPRQIDPRACALNHFITLPPNKWYRYYENFQNPEVQKGNL